MLGVDNGVNAAGDPELVSRLEDTNKIKYSKYIMFYVRLLPIYLHKL